MLLIGLTGLKQSGKSTVSRRLQNGFGFEPAKFSGALKEMLRAFLKYRGADNETIERMIEGDLKEVATPYLSGRTPRHAMLTLGTEWGRDLIEPNLWVDTEVEHIRTIAALGDCSRFVFEDVRFPNEVAAIRKLGGQIWRVARAGQVRPADAHVSERLEAVPDEIIRNETGDFAALWEQVDRYASAMLTEAHDGRAS